MNFMLEIIMRSNLHYKTLLLKSIFNIKRVKINFISTQNFAFCRRKHKKRLIRYVYINLLNVYYILFYIKLPPESALRASKGTITVCLNNRWTFFEEHALFHFVHLLGVAAHHVCRISLPTNVGRVVGRRCLPTLEINNKSDYFKIHLFYTLKKRGIILILIIIIKKRK